MRMPEVEQIVPTPGSPVVHVISDAGPHPYFRTLIEAGGADRQALMVGCVGSPGPLQADMVALGVRTFALGATRRPAYPFAIAKLARLLRNAHASVLQSHLVDGSLVGLPAARLAQVPVTVFTAHHSHELPYHGRGLVLADTLCVAALSTHVIAPSQQVAETLVRYAHVDREKIEVVHHGFDLSRLNPTEVNGKAVRNELGLGDALVLGAIGRIFSLKNYEALIRAFALLEATSAVKLVVAGPGDPEPLEALARDLGVAERVLLIGARSDVPELLAAFDAFVHPAIAESFGMVIIEAMAMAKPVLSTPVGIAPEVIVNGETGVLAPGPTVADLRIGLAELLALRGRWGAVGEAARKRASGFTAANMARRYTELYAQWRAG